MTRDVTSHWGVTSKNLQVTWALPTLMDICSSSFSHITDSPSYQEFWTLPVEILKEELLGRAGYFLPCVVSFSWPRKESSY